VSERRIALLGYGNPGRQDDGLGPAVAEAIGRLGWPGVTVDADYQLNIEDATVLAEHDVVLFADASIEGPEPYALHRITAAAEIAFTSHSVSPESIVAICEDHFGAPPEAWVLGIRGYGFEFEEGLTAKARANLDDAVAFTQGLIRVWKEQPMDTKKTILIIDDDPDIRASLRVVLEAEGFAVGEAATGEEGYKAVERSKPDAVVVDLMMEEVDSGITVAKKLKEESYPGPVYMLSSAGDTVQYNLDARDLGLVGIFQKPVSPKAFVATLKSKLAQD